MKVYNPLPPIDIRTRFRVYLIEERNRAKADALGRPALYEDIRQFVAPPETPGCNVEAIRIIKSYIEEQQQRVDDWTDGRAAKPSESVLAAERAALKTANELLNRILAVS